MTLLSREQIENLINLVATTEDDSITCEECFGKIGESVDLNLAGKEIPAVKRHLEQCPCCRDEYDSVTLAVSEVRKKLDDKQA